MAKEKFDASNVKGSNVTNVETLENGYSRFSFSDGTMLIMSVVPLTIRQIAEAEVKGKATDKKSAKSK